MVSTRIPVRRGGYPGPQGWVFELSGGRLCLDFANTVDDRPTDSPKERLVTHGDWLDWARQAGLLEPEHASARRLWARRFPSRAARALKRAHGVREAIFQVFSALGEGRRLPEESLAILQGELPRAFAAPALVRSGNRYGLSWQDDSSDPASLLAPIVRSAVKLLSSTDAERVRVCASPTCGWLFVDESRNRSRQWCDMTVCGNRAKARRFYERRKTRQAASRKGQALAR